MRKIASFIELLPQGFNTNAHRSTDTTVFTAARSSSQSLIGNVAMDGGKRAIFAMPSSHTVRHTEAAESLLFYCSGGPVQEALRLFREVPDDA